MDLFEKRGEGVVFWALFPRFPAVAAAALKLAFTPLFKLNLTSCLQHAHPAHTPDALALVPRACCFPLSSGQTDVVVADAVTVFSAYRFMLT